MQIGLLLLALASTPSHSAAAPPAIPYDLQAAVAGYDRAQLDGNRAELERLVADDYLLVNSTGKTETKAQLIADYMAAGFKLETLIIEQPVEKVWSDGAVMGGIAAIRGVDGGKPFDVRLRFADIWAKRNGRWQVVYTQAAKAPLAFTASSSPRVRLVDPRSLKTIVSFAQPDPRLRVSSGGEIWWRADVDLPPAASVTQISMSGYAPVVLHLSDGRCFQIGFEGRQPKMDEASIRQVTCETPPAKLPPDSAAPAPGMRYVGKAWDLDTWTNDASGKTMLVQTRDGRSRTVMTSSMRVLAVGAMGSPDTPMTEVTLAGMVGRQLTLVTVALYIP